MIVEINEALFLPEHADDTLLGTILRQGMQGRFAVKTRPAFKRDADRHANRWIGRQSDSAAETALKGFERGLSSPRQWPPGRAEPHVILEVREQPQWPTSFDAGPARLPLGDAAEDLLTHALYLKVENESADWHFLKAVVPSRWRKRWDKAVKRRWLKQEQGGGVSEIRRILEKEVARDPVRRLRMWVMFDSDATEPGAVSAESQRTRDACEKLEIPCHMLERRKNESYVPERAMRAWAADVASTLRRASNKPKLLEDADRLEKKIGEYWQLPDPERHVVDLKVHNKVAKHANRTELTGVWDGDHKITERELIADGWDAERKTLFLSIFASL